MRFFSEYCQQDCAILLLYTLFNKKRISDTEFSDPQHL